MARSSAVSSAAVSPPGARISIRGRCWTSPHRRCWLDRGLAASAVCGTAAPGAADAPGCPLCLAIRYTNQNDLLPANLQGVPTYAYPLYEIAAEALLLLGLWLFRKRLETRPGLSFLVAAVGYALIRFVLT